MNKILHIERASGFSSLRFFIWFTSSRVHGENVYSTQRADEAVADVINYLKDAEGAGFGRIFVSFGPVGKNSPTCRGKEWGDCFDDSTVVKSQKFIESVRRGIKIAEMESVWIDLSNEGGLSPFNSPLVHENYAKYLPPILEMYLRQFPSDKSTISVQQRNLVNRLQYVVDSYEHLGAYPSYFDIHVYDPNDPGLAELKPYLASEKAKVPVVIGEFPIGRFSDLPRVLAAIPDSTGGPPEAVLWPLADVDRGCGIDIKPPYRLGEFHGVIK